ERRERADRARGGKRVVRIGRREARERQRVLRAGLERSVVRLVRRREPEALPSEDPQAERRPVIDLRELEVAFFEADGDRAAVDGRRLRLVRAERARPLDELLATREERRFGRRGIEGRTRGGPRPGQG